MFKKLFLPVGMLVAVALAFILPEPGIFFKSLKLNNLLIIAIFLVCGWQTTAELKFDRNFLLLFITGALITLVAAPFAGWGIAKGFALDPMSAAGLMVIAAMPPTLSSGVVMTGTAEGNTLLAMTVTIGYSFIGVFILPVILPLVLPEGAEIVVKPWKMLTDLALLVILPAVAGAQALNIFVLKNFMEDIPQDLFDAAEIDGASFWQQMRHIVLPHIMPVIGALGILLLVNQWNSFVAPLLYLRDEELQMLSVALLHFEGEYTKNWGALMAGYVIASLPLIILFFFCMELFVKGLSSRAFFKR